MEVTGVVQLARESDCGGAVDEDAAGWRSSEDQLASLSDNTPLQLALGSLVRVAFALRSGVAVRHSPWIRKQPPSSSSRSSKRERSRKTAEKMHNAKGRT